MTVLQLRLCYVTMICCWFQVQFQCSGGANVREIVLCTFLLRATAWRSCSSLNAQVRAYITRQTCANFTSHKKQAHWLFLLNTLPTLPCILPTVFIKIRYLHHSYKYIIYDCTIVQIKWIKWIKWGLSPSTIPVSFSTSSEGNSPLLRRIRCRRSTPIAWLLCVPCCTLATTKTTLRTEKSVEFLRIKIYHVHIKVIQSPTKTHPLRHSICTYKSI